MTAEEIFEQYIGNGQMGIDFEKKHIIEAMEAYASHKVAKATKEMYPKAFIEWYIKEGNYGKIYTIEDFFKYWKQDIGK